MGIGRLTIRRTFGRVLVPGIPELQKQSDAPLAGLPIPTAAGNHDVSGRSDDYMVVEPEYVAPWLAATVASASSRSLISSRTLSLSYWFLAGRTGSKALTMKRP